MCKHVQKIWILKFNSDKLFFFKCIFEEVYFELIIISVSKYGLCTKDEKYLSHLTITGWEWDLLSVDSKMLNWKYISREGLK